LLFGAGKGVSLDLGRNCSMLLVSALTITFNDRFRIMEPNTRG